MSPVIISGIHINERKSDWGYVIFLFFNWVVAVMIGDMAMCFISDPCTVGVPYKCTNISNSGVGSYWPPESVASAFFWHMYDNDPLGYARPTWYMVTQWLGVFVWSIYYPVAIYAFIKGKNWIRIPTIMYCTSLILILTMIVSEGLFGDYQRSDDKYWSVVTENGPWLVIIPTLLFRMLSSDKPFGERVDRLVDYNDVARKKRDMMVMLEGSDLNINGKFD